MATTMPLVRNILSYKIIYGKERKLAYEMAELTHNLYVSILDENFNTHDLWILNHQVKSYYENTIFKDPRIIKVIKELFDIVPKELEDKLEWSCPII